MPAKALLSIAVVAALLAGGAWWGRDSATLQRWWPAGLAAVPGAATPSAAPGPRKCIGPDRVLYTDGACPAGTRAQALGGGSLSVLPAAPVAAPTTPATAASAQTPLRRLAGEGAVPDQTERRVDQALHR